MDHAFFSIDEKTRNDNLFHNQLVKLVKNPFHDHAIFAIFLFFFMAGTVLNGSFYATSKINGIISPHRLISRSASTTRHAKNLEAFPPSTARSSYGPANVSEGYAVICGINNYPNPDDALQCCDADANSMATLATSYFMIPEKHVIKLLDSSATIGAISSAITSTASKMDKNDYLLFSYSGHGSAAENITQHSWVVDSPHNYPNYYSHYWYYHFPGAAMIRVHFTEIDTEDGYDGVFVGNYYHLPKYYDLFTGYYTDVFSDWVQSDYLFVRLYSDSTINYWGFQIDYVEVLTWMMPCQILPYDFTIAGTSITGIDGASLNTLFNSVPGTTIALLDSCFSGGIGIATQAPNRYIMSASLKDEVSLEDPSGLKHGVFTNYFLDSWNTYDPGKTGNVSFEQVFPWISSSTVSKSSDLGLVQHPQQFDGTSGDLVLRTSASINSCTLNGNGSILVKGTLNGLGYGELYCAYYDQVNHGYAVQMNDTDVLSSQGTKTITINAPGGDFTPTSISVILKARYGVFVQTANYCVNITGYNPVYSTTDSDHDGLTDAQEIRFGSNPWCVDTDGDGINDTAEYHSSLSPFINDANGDYDGDGMPNWWEAKYMLDPWHANGNSDADNDGLTNLQELTYGTNPKNPDTDYDGLNDYQEIVHGTNPLNPDTDGDNFSDGVEVTWYSNPLNPGDSPMLHVFAWVMAFALIFVTLIGAKGIAKKHPYPHKGTHVPRPVETSIPVKELRRRPYTPPSRPTISYTPSWRPAPAATPARVPSSPYGGSLARQPFITGLPPLAPELQRKLAAMTPVEREIFTKILRQAFLEKMMNSQPRPVAKPPSIQRRFCIRCGTLVIGNRCPTCGYVFPPF